MAQRPPISRREACRFGSKHLNTNPLISSHSLGQDPNSQALFISHIKRRKKQSETISPKMQITATSALTCLAALGTAVTATPFSKRASFSGFITPIGEISDAGALSACGQEYVTGSMFVAVQPSLLPADCSPAPISIQCNGKTVSAQAVDKCMGCGPDHIDVSAAVYEACGGEKGGIDPLKDVDWSL